MTCRAGMSLTEVLVALFILTLGVIGILTMFPLGAAQMAMAVRDDRSAQAAGVADAYMRWYWQNYVISNQSPNGVYSNPVNALDPSFQPPPRGPGQLGGLFDNPALAASSTNQLSTVPSIFQVQNGLITYNNYNGLNNNVPGLMSYPVVVDPMGNLVRPNTFGDAATPTLIPRCSLAILNNPTFSNTNNPSVSNSLTYKACSLIDSLGYNDNGTPNGDLEMRYNWMWVLQRPQSVNEISLAGTGLNIGVNGQINNTNVLNTYNSDTNLYTANMTVVVFDRRALLYPPPSVSGFEVAFNATFTTGLTSVTLNLNAADQALDLKPGSWVMDATIIPSPAPTTQYPKPPPIRQAYFYRVVTVTQVSGTQVNLELQSPVTPPTGYAPIGYSYAGTLVALRGVAGVFVRPPLTWY